MTFSKKSGSKSNLYRARRKLLKSIEKKSDVFSGDRSIPEDWHKPVIGPGKKNSEHVSLIHLTVTANPLPGQDVKVGQYIEDLTLSISPRPVPGTTVEYRVHCGSKTEGPFTLPVDERGVATGAQEVTGLCEAESRISIEWIYLGQKAIAEWTIIKN